MSIYSVLAPPNLTPAQSNRVCNSLALLQVVHMDISGLLFSMFGLMFMSFA